ncbi:hypothetical protein C8R45DRAFT_948847 [Mycena sanguinolenta]|nr:hypothetical protein C8R45DRAFT_948847 [Mycena sanguinolenta]
MATKWRDKKPLNVLLLPSTNHCDLQSFQVHRTIRKSGSIGSCLIRSQRPGTVAHAHLIGEFADTLNCWFFPPPTYSVLSSTARLALLFKFVSKHGSFTSTVHTPPRVLRTAQKICCAVPVWSVFLSRDLIPRKQHAWCCAIASRLPHFSKLLCPVVLGSSICVLRQFWGPLLGNGNSTSVRLLWCFSNYSSHRVLRLSRLALDLGNSIRRPQFKTGQEFKPRPLHSILTAPTGGKA